MAAVSVAFIFNISQHTTVSFTHRQINDRTVGNNSLFIKKGPTASPPQLRRGPGAMAWTAWPPLHHIHTEPVSAAPCSAAEAGGGWHCSQVSEHGRRP